MLYLGTLFSRSRPLLLALGGAIAIFGFTACDSGGGIGGDTSGTLSFNFQATSDSSSSSSASLLKSAHDSVVVDGSNGTLKIKDIRFIVEEFELGGEEDSLDFEAPPSFLDLPLDETEFASADTADVPTGTYSEFEFEVDNLDPDEDDTPEEKQQIQDLLDQIREEFPNFPRKASMIASGTFTPTNGAPTNFTSYIEAEIEIEQEFEQNPLKVTSDGFSRSLTVKLDPSTWFEQSDGRIRNLAQYQSTDDLLEIEREKFENGVVDVEPEGERGEDSDGESDEDEDDEDEDDEGEDDEGEDDEGEDDNGEDDDGENDDEDDDSGDDD